MNYTVGHIIKYKYIMLTLSQWWSDWGQSHSDKQTLNHY